MHVNIKSTFFCHSCFYVKDCNKNGWMVFVKGQTLYKVKVKVLCKLPVLDVGIIEFQGERQIAVGLGTLWGEAAGGLCVGPWVCSTVPSHCYSVDLYPFH